MFQLNLIFKKDNVLRYNYEKNYIEKTHRDSKDANQNKEVLQDYRKNGDSYSTKNYKENKNIVSERLEIDRNLNLNSYGNKDERRINDEYSNSNNNRNDSNKFEVLKPSSINNANLGSSSTVSNKLDKSGKASDKIKFSNINNLEFFNQKYHK